MLLWWLAVAYFKLKSVLMHFELKSNFGCLSMCVLIHYCAVTRVVASAFLGSFWCIIGDSNLARLFLSGFEGVLSGC